MESWVDECRKTLRLAGPLVGAQGAIMSMAVVDNLVVGRLGPGPLAAMAMALTLYYFCYIIIIGILTTVGPLVSTAVSRGEAVGPTVRRAWLLSLTLSVGMIAACRQGHVLLPLLGQDPKLVPRADEFLRSASWGVPAATGYLALRQFTEGTGDTRASVVISGLAACINPFLDLGLILGRFGLPRLEMSGAGLALSTANWIAFLCLVGYLACNRRYRAWPFWRGSGGTSMLGLLKLGLPMGGSLLSEMSFFAVMTLLMGTLGTVQLASHQIAMNVCSLFFTLPLGLSFAAALRLGEAAGRHDANAVRRAGRTSIAMVLVTQCASCACFLLFAERIVSCYTEAVPVVALAARLLRMGALFQVFDGLQVVGMGMLRGLLDTRVPFLNAIFSYWLVGVPCGVWLAFSRHWGPIGLWTGLITGLLVAACLHQWRFHRLSRGPAFG
ncbi:MAG TPA: MATE family efflux transporter [Candidatus Xenobia bacterium]